MSVVIDDNLKKICKKVAADLNIPEIVIITVYYQYIKTLKQEIEKIPIKNTEKIMSEEEFMKYHTSFNIRHLGKIFTNYEIYKTKKSII